MSVSKKIVLVTGCSKGGIGFSLCEELAERGCIVYASARKIEKMEGFKHTDIRRIALDVTDDEQVQNAVKEIVDAEGRIDIVINNAGLLCIGPAIEIPIDQAKSVFDTNVFAILRMARAVIPHMAARKQGLIVNVSSVVGEVPTPWAAIYCASKAALNTLTEVLQMECKPFNIHITLLCPGSVQSQIADNNAANFRGLSPDSIYTKFLDQILKRMWLSQTMNSMPAEVFCSIVADKVLKREPPRYMIVGGNWLLVSLAKMLPRSVYLWYSWRKFTNL